MCQLSCGLGRGVGWHASASREEALLLSIPTASVTQQAKARYLVSCAAAAPAYSSSSFDTKGVLATHLLVRGTCSSTGISLSFVWHMLLHLPLASCLQAAAASASSNALSLTNTGCPFTFPPSAAVLLLLLLAPHATHAANGLLHTVEEFAEPEHQVAGRKTNHPFLPVPHIQLSLKGDL